MRLSLTYGVMPTEVEFEAAWAAVEAEGGLRAGTFTFGRDPRVGNAALSCTEPWAELEAALADFEAGDEAAGDWCSCVLSCLGIEWI